MNDKADVHETGSDPIGIELHYLLYQYNTADYLNDVTFINLKVINRGTETLSDFRVGCFSDLDLGNPTDDYIGVNVDRNMMYIYNADNLDEAGMVPGYGTNPPALGVSMLNHDAGETPYCAPVFAGEAELKTLDFELYPNPSTGSFQIISDGQYQVNIFAMDGRMVYTDSH
ncbi:MAG: hypothetical protein ACPG21_13620 [Crocinitomicaceae bacterium]